MNTNINIKGMKWKIYVHVFKGILLEKVSKCSGNSATLEML